jgi:hypothetical protein
MVASKKDAMKQGVPVLDNDSLAERLPRIGGPSPGVVTDRLPHLGGPPPGYRAAVGTGDRYPDGPKTKK